MSSCICGPPVMWGYIALHYSSVILRFIDENLRFCYDHQFDNKNKVLLCLLQNSPLYILMTVLLEVSCDVGVPHKVLP